MKNSNIKIAAGRRHSTVVRMATISGAVIASIAVVVLGIMLAMSPSDHRPIHPIDVSSTVRQLLTDSAAADRRDWLIKDRASRLQTAVQFRTVSSGNAHSSTCGCSQPDASPHVQLPHSSHNGNDGDDAPPSNDDLPAESRRELRAMQAWLRTAFPLVHQHLRVEVVAEHSLLYTWTGRDESLAPVMLCAHLDVVPVSEYTRDQWHHDPFSGHMDMESGFLYGRGTLDFKNGVVGTLEAVESLLSKSVTPPRRSLILAFGHDEEIMGLRGAVEIAKVLRQRRIRPHFILDEGTPIIRNGLPTVTRDIAMISVAEKGFLNLRLRIRSLGGHSSMTPTNGTVISRMVEALHLLQNNPPPAAAYHSSPAAQMLHQVAPHSSSPLLRTVLSNGWLFDKVPFLLNLALKVSPSLVNFFVTTQAVTMVQGGEAPNVLPNDASAVVNFRIVSESSVQDVQKHVIGVLSRAGLMDPKRPFYDKEYIGGHIVMDKAITGINSSSTSAAFTAFDPSQLSPSDGPAYTAIARSIRTLHPEAIIAPSLMIAGTDTKHYTTLTDSIYRFSPLVLGMEDVGRIHGVNERISIQGYSRYVDFFIVLIATACGLE